MMHIFHRLTQKAGAPADHVQPRKSSEVPPYLDAFRSSARFSATTNATLEPMTLVPTAEDPRRHADALKRLVVSNRITEDDFRASAGQCLKWAHFLAPHIERETGIPAWPTLGQLWKGDRKLWGPGWNELHDFVKHGVHQAELASREDGGLNMHAWVTLATGEIVDLTYASTLAVVKGGNYAQYLGLIAYGPEDKVFNGHRYFPMLAGRAAFESLQQRSSVRFLAGSRAELTKRGVAFAQP